MFTSTHLYLLPIVRPISIYQQKCYNNVQDQLLTEENADVTFIYICFSFVFISYPNCSVSNLFKSKLTSKVAKYLHLSEAPCNEQTELGTCIKIWNSHRIAFHICIVSFPTVIFGPWNVNYTWTTTRLYYYITCEFYMLPLLCDTRIPCNNEH